MPDQVNHAGLDDRLRKDCVDRLGKALQAVDDGDQDVLDAAVPQLVHDAQPELRALCRLDPDAENVLGAVGLALETVHLLGRDLQLVIPVGDEAIDFAAGWLDAINVDLKAFSDDYYRRLCKARLQPVLDTIAYIVCHTDIWIEVTTLLIPGENDSEEELKQLADFLVRQAGPDVPWHISRFYPQYKYVDAHATSMDSLGRAERIGKDAGLRYVYLGNVPGTRSESTFCYKCGRLLIERAGYQIVANVIENSRCPQCGTEIAGFEL